MRLLIFCYMFLEKKCCLFRKQKKKHLNQLRSRALGFLVGLHKHACLNLSEVSGHRSFMETSVRQELVQNGWLISISDSSGILLALHFGHPKASTLKKKAACITPLCQMDTTGYLSRFTKMLVPQPRNLEYLNMF